MFTCHQDDVCENYIGNVYVGGYCGLSESCECSLVLFRSIVMSYVDRGNDGYVVR